MYHGLTSVCLYMHNDIGQSQGLMPNDRNAPWLDKYKEVSRWSLLPDAQLVIVLIFYLKHQFVKLQEIYQT